MVKKSNSGSEGQGFKPCLSHCYLRQGTLLHFVSSCRCITGYQLLTAGGGVTLQWTSIPSRGVAILLGMLHDAKETGISSGCLGVCLVCPFTSIKITHRTLMQLKKGYEHPFLIRYNRQFLYNFRTISRQKEKMVLNEIFIII